MHSIIDQALASTNLDSQGERLSKSFLEKFLKQAGTTPFPIHQQHDMSKPVAGYIENLRLVPDCQNSGEWQLIGDVYFEEGMIENVLGGFSISGTEMLYNSASATALIFIPFPYYNDQELIDTLTVDPELNVGKWIKKGAEPVSWVLLGSVLAFAITPVWDDVYKRKIAPRIDALLSQHLSNLKQKNLSPELIQIVLFQNKQVEVRLIPNKGKEAECLHSTIVYIGLQKVVGFLSTDSKANNVGVKRVVVFFDDAIGEFSIHRIEYTDGTILHMA